MNSSKKSEFLFLLIIYTTSILSLRILARLPYGESLGLALLVTLVAGAAYWLLFKHYQFTEKVDTALLVEREPHPPKERRQFALFFITLFAAFFWVLQYIEDSLMKTVYMFIGPLGTICMIHALFYRRTLTFTEKGVAFNTIIPGRKAVIPYDAIKNYSIRDNTLSITPKDQDMETGMLKSGGLFTSSFSMEVKRPSEVGLILDGHGVRSLILMLF